MSVSPPPMAIHNSMVELCCYATPIAMGIGLRSLDPHRVFQHPRDLTLIGGDNPSEAFAGWFSRAHPHSTVQNGTVLCTYNSRARMDRAGRRHRQSVNGYES